MVVNHFTFVSTNRFGIIKPDFFRAVTLILGKSIENVKMYEERFWDKITESSGPSYLYRYMKNKTKWNHASLLTSRDGQVPIF